MVVRAGVGGVGGALNYAKELGMTVVVDEQYPPNTTDFTGLVQKAKAANADILLQLGLPNDTLQVGRTVQQQGYKPAIFCTCGSQVDDAQGLGRTSARRQSSASVRPSLGPRSPSRASPSSAKRSRRAATRRPPLTRSAAPPFCRCWSGRSKARSPSIREIKDFIQKNEFKTVAGTFKYQEDGTPVYSQILLQYLKGKNEVVWPKEFRTAEPVLRTP